MHRLRLLALLAGLFALAGGLTATRADDKGDWVTIKGQVKRTENPALIPINVTTDPAHCQSKGKLLPDDVIVNPKNGGLKNVVVWLRADADSPQALKDGRKAAFPADKINPARAKAAPQNHVIDQPCCQFIPRILAARAGDQIVIKNSSPVNHNTNMAADGMLNPRYEFNVNIPPGGLYAPNAPLAAQYGVIPFACNIHPWMQGKVRVFDHPYYAVTDADGKFEIKDAPAGKWRLVYWHEGGFHKGRAGVDGEAVEVKAGSDSTMELKPIDFAFPKPTP